MKTVAEVIGVARSNLAECLRERPPKQIGRPPLPDAELVAQIKAVIAELPTYGYRRVHAILKRQALAAGLKPRNHKRIYRVMKAHGLLLDRHAGGVERRLFRPRIGAGLSSFRQRGDHHRVRSAALSARGYRRFTGGAALSQHEGIGVLVDAELLQVRGRSGDEVTLIARTALGEQRIDGSDILAAAGRIPNTAGIGLKEAGVELDGRGYIRVNGRLETSAPDVWAIGECAGSPQFTHVSEDDFRIIRDNLAGGNRSTRDRLVPYCMFTDPQLARVGLSEGEAERRGVIARVARLPMDSVLGAQATDQMQGFMKAVVADGDDRILGFTMIGAAAGEVMAAVHTAMLAGLSYAKLANADFAHPTMAEGLSSLFSSVPPRAVQTEPKAA
jgi:Pyridine nucleotide-disulphide oxidoreductase, dimerisation domain/Pyridine nucleotide-disulphide oxidoreductase/HTH-like domain